MIYKGIDIFRKRSRLPALKPFQAAGCTRARAARSVPRLGYSSPRALRIPQPSALTLSFPSIR